MKKIKRSRIKKEKRISKPKKALNELWELFYNEELPKKEKYYEFEELFKRNYDIIENVRYADEPIDIFLNYLAIWGKLELEDVCRDFKNN